MYMTEDVIKMKLITASVAENANYRNEPVTLIFELMKKDARIPPFWGIKCELDSVTILVLYSSSEPTSYRHNQGRQMIEGKLCPFFKYSPFQLILVDN